MLFAMRSLFLWINFFVEQKYQINNQLPAGAGAIHCAFL